MIRLMVILAAGATAVLLLVGLQGGKLPVVTSLSAAGAGPAPDGVSDSHPRKSAEDGYRIINDGTYSSERASTERVALRFRETEAKQGLGSATDQRPRPALGGSNRGKSSKQS